MGNAQSAGCEITDGNTINNTAFGMRLYPTGTDTLEFTDILNNNVTVPKQGDYQPEGIFFITGRGQETDPHFFGIGVTANTFTQSSVSYGTAINAIGISLPGTTAYTEGEVSDPPAPGSFIAVQSNVITGFVYGLEAGNGPDVLAYQNRISNGSYAIRFDTLPSQLLLVGNIYTGNQLNYYYAGSARVETLELPQGAILCVAVVGGSASQTLQLENACASSLSWAFTVAYNGSSLQSWASSGSTSGVIAAELSGYTQILCDSTGLTAGTYSAVITITYDGGLTRNIDLTFIVGN